jgi:hypothetical protein
MILVDWIGLVLLHKANALIQKFFKFRKGSFLSSWFSCIALGLHFYCAWFESLVVGNQLSCLSFIHGFPQSLQANARIIPEDMIESFMPFPISYLLNHAVI